MYSPQRGLFEQVTPDQRAYIVSELCGLLESLSCSIEDVCDNARDLEKGLNDLLYGESRENPFRRFERTLSGW